ncbi:hypothetical protein SAMN02745157_3178 [Kaistia soli DSM 19436]|uniref:Cytochrome c556 n=1 Tax=Kaistia soli DSM 19436 TaxID=1122133 RepID=A0A1M5FUQ5_9HYPH|nr:hypothetical protein [Kaistia soli]SHF95265.1 hypothetical protein SAMN02745157_3178 [Kaistia soli DSM 19436]
MSSKLRIAALMAIAGFAVTTASGIALAQSTDQQMQQMEKKLDMNATPDMAALAFQDDLAALEECQSGCKPLIERMLGKYKTDPTLGGNPKLGASDAAQLAAALATAAATLPKADAEKVGSDVTASLGADAGAAFAGAYAGTTAPYNPQ